jgi:hypothetical protein
MRDAERLRDECDRMVNSIDSDIELMRESERIHREILATLNELNEARIRILS